MKRLSVIFCLMVLTLTTPLFLLNGCADSSGSNNSTSDSDSDSDSDDDGNIDPNQTINIFIDHVESDCSGGDPLISAYALVIDGDGNPYEGLTEDDFDITENSNAISDFQFSSPEDGPISISEPISISIIMDYSNSMQTSGYLEDMETAVISFITEMEDEDQAEILKFNEGIADEISFTSKKQDLIDFVNESVSTEPQQTHLYNTLYRGIGDLADLGTEERKAVVAITDGANSTDGADENITLRTIDEVIDLAQDNNVPLFIVGLADEDAEEEVINEGLLLEMASKTSGHYYRALDSADLLEIYPDIIELFNEGHYLFVFDGTPGGETTGTLSITVTDGEYDDSATTEFSYDCD